MGLAKLARACWCFEQLSLGPAKSTRSSCLHSALYSRLRRTHLLFPTKSHLKDFFGPLSTSSGARQRCNAKRALSSNSGVNSANSCALSRFCAQIPLSMHQKPTLISKNFRYGPKSRIAATEDCIFFVQIQTVDFSASHSEHSLLR